ncbi:hypothetical protein AKO1_008078 [Acrasis kona]|uniref:Uncharacterized protein n=1 Tax=Acrasis kona TaxID=1008807 RepID=A0AAW2YRF5_9EUKA
MTRDQEMNDHSERQIMEGVYMTDFRKKNNQQNLASDPKLSPEEIKERQNQIDHLERSNQEMLEYDPERKDQEIQEYILENVKIIKKYKIQIENSLKDSGDHYDKGVYL